jgi:hypothetical protein
MSKHRSKHENTLPGDIGYRTRGGRSGLDPIDTRLEWGRLQGQFIRKLLTGKLHLRNPIYIIITAAIGISLFMFPMLGIIAPREVFPDMQMSLDGVACLTLIFWPMGFPFLYNAALALHVRNQSRGSGRKRERHAD